MAKKSRVVASAPVKTQSANAGNGVLKAFLSVVANPYTIGAICAVITYWCLIEGMWDFLFRGQELSLFLNNKAFWLQQLSVPGGFTTYVAAWLTQFCYYPAIGAAIMVVLWYIVYVLQLVIYKPAKQWAILCWLAPLAMMCIITDLGYWLYHLKTVGYFFQATVGMLGLLGMVSVARLFKGWSTMRLSIIKWSPVSIARFFKGWSIYLGIPLLIAVGYPLFGFYGLLAGGYLLLQKGGQIYIRLAIAALSIWLIPLGYYYCYTDISLPYSYISLLPFFYMDPSIDISIYVPYGILIVSPLLVWATKYLSVLRGAMRFVPTIALAIVMIFAARSFWYDDYNFREELYLNRAAEEQRWDDIINRAYQEVGEPTRLMVLYRNLALLRTEQGGDIMFRFAQGGKRPNAKFDERMMQSGGKMIYYHYGKLNFCYRWCLEDAVECGMKIDYIRYMAKCAMYSGDYNLARKYLGAMKQTMFYADWAEEQEALLNDPDKLYATEEYKDITSLMDYENQLDSDSNLAELYLLNTLSHSWSDNPLYQEASLMATLVMKDIPLFWPRFFGYLQTHQRIPVHYQEAAVLYASLEPNMEVTGANGTMPIRDAIMYMPIDEAVRQRFSAFQQTANNNSHRTETQLTEVLRPQWGDTFYYFYFLIRDIQTN